MKNISIDRVIFQVEENEFEKYEIEKFCNLKLYKDIGEQERLIGLLNDLSTDLGIKNLICIDTTHGGFIPIKCSYVYENVNIYLNNDSNIKTNIRTQNIQNIHFPNDIDNNSIMFISKSNINIYIYSNIILSITPLNLDNYFIYRLSNTKYFLYISKDMNDFFIKNFWYYISDDLLEYDNLINLCIMVKNGGEQFEKMLLDNIEQFDRWTILDTGSTDNTINIINKVLVGKKKGNLYQEPFINFRDSRNRLLDLAGTQCKFNTMLDDTYVIQGDLRSFLNEVRGDIYSDSFTLFIQSDDTSYGSNRIIKSLTGLRYVHKIHEVITDRNNINIVIPINISKIEDRRFDYTEKRTMERKQLDLKLLYEEVEDDPNNPRSYYYLAQTYNILEDYEKAFYYFNKRCEYINSGFLQERYDAAFEAARMANFKLNKPWEECEKLYLNAFKIDESRPESLYFIGIHYYLENKKKKAYDLFKQGFEIGFPEHCQYSLKPTLSFHYLPKFLTRVCYDVEDYLLGEKVSQFFLLNNKNNADDYEEILSWHKIFQKLNIYKEPKIPVTPVNEILCFVADGGFNPWSGSTILTDGVGGSETYIIEMSRYIKKNSNFDVYVFCNTPEEKDEIFEGVYYKHLNSYYKFINTNYVKHCIISRYSEYLPITFKGFTENVYFVIHDLTPSGIVIPIDLKLKNIFCLTEWHVQYFTERFPTLKDITIPLYYGIDDLFKNKNEIHKHKNKFIYSSFPNRGLLQLLQMWPKIYKKNPTSTLHIYSDIDNKWSNDVDPEKMSLIKNILNEYNYKKNGFGIYYHGWVNKKELANAWSSVDIWFYPCTFMETFCLTALEAASSKTLCITNDLAALKNTVGNRGIIIKGDPNTEEWQQQALTQLFYIMDENNSEIKDKFIIDNYNWAKSLSWENQAKKLLEEYIYPNNIFEYKGMYNWTHDLPYGSKNIFNQVISYFNSNNLKVKFGKPINVLEIGTYSGTSLIGLINSIPNSTGLGIDLWSNYNKNLLLEVMYDYKVKESFYKNIKNAGLEKRISGIQIDSILALLQFIKDDKKFDFIYIDGFHLLLDCYSDLILSWEILEKGGILAIDDYYYKKDENIIESPFEAVNHFMKKYNGQYKTLFMGYRVFLEKL
jgi:predicted O-methyltransferase YrrM